jgi:hypothetical protein
MATTRTAVRVVPAPDGSWGVAGSPITRAQHARLDQSGVRRDSAVFFTPPCTRKSAAELTVPPSAHVPSRVGLSVTMHKLACPSCRVTGQLVLNGTHGIRRSVKCKAPKPGGRVCGRNWAGKALAQAVEVAWNDIQEDMLAEQEDPEVADIDSDGDEKGLSEDDGADPGGAPRPRTTAGRDVLPETGYVMQGYIDQLAAMNVNLERSQTLLARSQEMQADLQGLLTAERRRADQLAAALSEAQEELRHKISIPNAEQAQVTQPAVPAQVQRPSFAAIVRRQQQEKSQAVRPTEKNNLHENMRTELRRIGAITAPPSAPTWRGMTAVYFRNLNRCPVGQLRAIIRSAVHRDAAIGLSFIGRNVAEILCARNRTTDLTQFLESMGAKPMPDYRPDVENTAVGRGTDQAGNRNACLARWGRELETCPVRARTWYQECIDTARGSHLETPLPAPDGPLSEPAQENASGQVNGQTPPNEETRSLDGDQDKADAVVQIVADNDSAEADQEILSSLHSDIDRSLAPSSGLVSHADGPNILEAAPSEEQATPSFSGMNEQDQSSQSGHLSN